jgi:hypothetical protein
MSREKLAYIAEVEKVVDIPNKDRIKVLHFKNLDWDVIGGLTMPAGTKVIYIERDTLIPLEAAGKLLGNDENALNTMKSRCYSPKYDALVIRPMKMAGVVSYGIAFGLDVLTLFENVPRGLAPGTDLTAALGILPRPDQNEEGGGPKLNIWQKFWYRLFPRLNPNRKPGGGFPDWIGKTDETQVESLPYVYDENHQGKKCYTTVKVDGQSGTYAVLNDEFYACSRNNLLYREKLSLALKELSPRRAQKYSGNSWVKIAALKELPRKMKQFLSSHPEITGLAIQGELAGPGIQSNKLGLPGLELFVFNYFDIGRRKYGGWSGIEAFCLETGLVSVPFIEETTFHWKDKAELKKYAEGKYPSGRDREGVVIRFINDDGSAAAPEEGMSNMRSFKVVNDKFALKADD